LISFGNHFLIGVVQIFYRQSHSYTSYVSSSPLFMPRMYLRGATKTEI